MKRHVSLILASIFTLTVSAKASPPLSPFTSDLIGQYGLKDEDIKNLQFYISGDIVLERVLGRSEAAVKGHALRSSSNERIEEVKLKARTPGIVELVANHSLTVSFEANSTLEFCEAVDKRGRQLNQQETFSLCAPRWAGQTGFVQYGGREFMTMPGSNNVFLLVNLKQLNKVKKKSRTVRGRTL